MSDETLAREPARIEEDARIDARLRAARERKRRRTRPVGRRADADDRSGNRPWRICSGKPAASPA